MSINKNIFYTIVAQIPTIILGIASGVFITRILGPNGKGVFAVFQANSEFLGFFLGFNIVSGLVYFTASRKIKLEKLLGMSVYFFILICIIVCTFFEIIMHTSYKSYFMPKEYSSFFYVFYLVFIFCCGITNTIFSGIMQGDKNFKAINIISLINGIINVICFGSLYVLMKSGLLAVDIRMVFVVILIIAFINSVNTFVFYLMKIRVKPDFNINLQREVKPFFKYISVTYVIILVNFFNYRLDVWVLMHYSIDMKPVGFYALAVSVAQLLWMVSNPFMMVLFPYLSESNTEVRIKKTTMYSRLNVAILLLGILFLCSVGHYLLPIMYGKSFIDSVKPFEILLIGLFFSSANKPLGTFFNAEDKFIINLYANLIGVFFTVIFCFWLIPSYGIMGACIATDVSYLAIFLFTYIVFLVQSEYTAKNWFLLRKADLEELGFNRFFYFLRKGN